MYKQMAAYAMGLIHKSANFSLGRIDGFPVWGIAADGGHVMSRLNSANKLSILGAMRAAQEDFDADLRPYNTLDRLVRHYANEMYHKDMLDLNHAEALGVLRVVAK